MPLSTPSTQPLDSTPLYALSICQSVCPVNLSIHPPSGQSEEISAKAAQYVLWAAPALLLSSIKSCCRSYLSAQGLVLPLTVLTTASTLLSPFLNYLFINT